MDLDRLDELKEQLLHDAELAPVWTYFMDHFSDHAEFVSLGEPTTHGFLESVVPEIGKQLFGKNVRMDHLLLLRIPEKRFVHGGLGFGGRLGGVIYFEDARIGMLAVSDAPFSAEAKYVRFSGEVVRKTNKPSVN